MDAVEENGGPETKEGDSGAEGCRGDHIESSRTGLVVILVRPEDPRNVGAVVRAAANFGATVRLVPDPARPWGPEEERWARVASSRAWEHAGGVALFETLPQAAADCAVLAGTSARRRRDAGESVTPEQFFSQRSASTVRKKQDSHGERPALNSSLIAVAFGPESNGLTAEELGHSSVWIKIPTSPEFPSLNLAQAALLVCYEAWRAHGRLREGPDTLPHAQE